MKRNENAESPIMMTVIINVNFRFFLNSFNDLCAFKFPSENIIKCYLIRLYPVREEGSPTGTVLGHSTN